MAWLERFGSRCPPIQLKDMDAAGDFAPVGGGRFDFARILAVAEGLGVDGCIVEQGLCKDSPFDAVAASFRRLKRVAPALVETL
ncbi:MAG: hypothetical protein IT578_02525 [Verrucomicrobiae bacterium]|nr:hypothetical protein [Verrucomicrobiae bacterium]